MRPFSKINLCLVVFNLCLLLGIAYLWYPTFREAPLSSPSEMAAERPSREWPPQPLDRPVGEVPADEPLVTTTPTTTPIGEEPREEVLPETVNLPVPFTSQAPEGNWDQPWQDACEEAAILMLDAYYKQYNLSSLFAKDELQKMVDWQQERGWGNSIPIAQIAEAARAYMGESFDIQIIKDPTITRIQSYLAAGHPVYVVADGKMLDNPNFTNGGPEYHALILRGYTETGFITNDPGTRNGNAFFYTYANLMASIHDWNGGDVPAGQAVVLVALPRQ